MRDTMGGLDTFDIGYAAAKAEYIHELQAKYDSELQNLRDELKEKLELAENRIRELQEQKPVCVVRMSNPPDGNPKPIPKWIMSELDNVVGVLADGDKLYTMPPIPPELAELQKVNAELHKQLEARERWQLFQLIQQKRC